MLGEYWELIKAAAEPCNYVSWEFKELECVRFLLKQGENFLASIHRPSIIDIPPSNVDIVLGDEEFSLSEYGIPGRILYTPGHSMGSVSVLLDTGDAFVGDLAMSGFPMRLTPGLPALAEDMQKVRESWQLLIKAGAKTIYPAHGKHFSVDIIQRALL